MLIDKKYLQTMQILKIKHDIDEFPLPSNYLYIDEKKCIFISKFKNKLYHVNASPACNLANIESQAYFNVIYVTDNLEDAIKSFKFFVKELL